jgi:hypothetical protein
MIVEMVFGPSSPHFEQLEKIRFESRMLMASYTELYACRDRQKQSEFRSQRQTCPRAQDPSKEAWSRGQEKLVKLFNKMLKDYMVLYGYAI